jgi:ribosomal protein S18 acetylase RimI-like enzyme
VIEFVTVDANRWWRSTTSIEVVGFVNDCRVASCDFNDWDSASPSIWDVQVDAAHRRRGYGTELIRFAVEHAQRAGKRSLTLMVRSDNRAAIRLYERCGFARRDVRDDIVHMGRPLVRREAVAS